MQRATLAVAAVLALSAAMSQQTSMAAAASESLTVTHVRGTVYMVTAPNGLNTTVQIGRYGPIVLDTPAPALVPQLLAEIKKLSPQRIRFLMHTTPNPDYMAGDVAVLSGASVAEGILHSKVYDRLTATPAANLWPFSVITYSQPLADTYNSEPIILYQAGPATTDGDSIVHFRTSDVISTGPIYTPGRYPVIDLENGGTIEGLIDALYKALDVAVSDNLGDTGTLIIPGRGRVAEELDLGEYRNMVVIITDRIRDMRRKGMTLEQVKAGRPSLDYDTEYHATRADADRFVESIYRTLPQSEATAAQNAQQGGSRP